MLRLLISFVIVGACVLPGQTAAESGTGFEVATIKQSRPEEQLSIRVKGRQFVTTGGSGVGFNGPGAITVKDATMADFAGLLQRYVTDRPTVDRTGLSGRYDFSLTWTPEPSFGDGSGAFPAPRTPREDEPAGLYGAIQQQPGLKLQPAKAPVDVIAIEAAERPSTN